MPYGNCAAALERMTRNACTPSKARSCPKKPYCASTAATTSHDDATTQPTMPTACLNANAPRPCLCSISLNYSPTGSSPPLLDWFSGMLLVFFLCLGANKWGQGCRVHAMEGQPLCACTTMQHCRLACLLVGLFRARPPVLCGMDVSPLRVEGIKGASQCEWRAKRAPLRLRRQEALHITVAPPFT